MVWRGVEIKNATIRPCLVRPLTDWCLFGVFVSWWRNSFFIPLLAGRLVEKKMPRRHEDTKFHQSVPPLFFRRLTDAPQKIKHKKKALRPLTEGLLMRREVFVLSSLLDDHKFSGHIDTACGNSLINCSTNYIIGGHCDW